MLLKNILFKRTLMPCARDFDKGPCSLTQDLRTRIWTPGPTTKTQQISYPQVSERACLLKHRLAIHLPHVYLKLWRYLSIFALVDTCESSKASHRVVLHGH